MSILAAEKFASFEVPHARLYGMLAHRAKYISSVRWNCSFVVVGNFGSGNSIRQPSGMKLIKPRKYSTAENSSSITAGSTPAWAFVVAKIGNNA